MADSTIPLNSGTGGKTLDTESLVGAGAATVERSRQQISGAALAEVARVINTTAAGTEYGLVTRVASTPALPAGTNNIGDVDVLTLPPLPAGTAVIGALSANQTVNLAQVGGVAALTSEGATGTGSERVTLATVSAAANLSSTVGSVSLGSSTGKVNRLQTGTLVTTATTADQVALTFTVTAGKTLYLTYLSISSYRTVLSATAAILGTASLETPSATKTITERFTNPTTSAPHTYVITFPEPIPVAAGVVVRVVCTPADVTSTTWRANFGGYEK